MVFKPPKECHLQVFTKLRVPEKLHLLSSHWGALRQTRGMAWLMMSSLQCPGRKKNHLFWGKSSMWWSEACLEMSVCLYSTGRDASMSVFHSMTVNPHYGGGLINLLLLKMPKHFSCERIKIASQFAFFCCCCCLLFALLPQSENLIWHWD